MNDLNTIHPNEIVSVDYAVVQQEPFEIVETEMTAASGAVYLGPDFPSVGDMRRYVYRTYRNATPASKPHSLPRQAAR